MLQVQHLNFHYDDKQVLHDINLSIEAGSITGVIGPNGAGKSTLMRCMAALEIPSSGQVLFNQQPILDNPRETFSQLGYLPDFFGLPANLTVAQCLAYAAKSRDVPDYQLEDTIIETLHLLGLQDKISHKVSTLSRGQKQRVGIGQVIVHRPRLLLLDEPASGLDPEARHELSLLFRQLRTQGMSLLVSSHILSELDEYCTHMLVIKDGRIQAHQALHDNHEEQQILSLKFQNLNAEMLETLRRLTMVQQLEMHDDAIWVTLAAGENARVNLLRETLMRGLPLSEATVVKASLLDNYLNSTH